MISDETITLCELINELSACMKRGQVGEVVYDFVYFYPNGRIASYRGDYSDLALGYTCSDWRRYENPGSPYASITPPKVSDLLEVVQKALGHTFEGYKGGEYKAGPGSYVWVANYGESGSTAIVKIDDHFDGIMIHTAHIDV